MRNGRTDSISKPPATGIPQVDPAAASSTGKMNTFAIGSASKHGFGVGESSEFHSGRSDPKIWAFFTGWRSPLSRQKRNAANVAFTTAEQPVFSLTSMAIRFKKTHLFWSASGDHPFTTYGPDIHPFPVMRAKGLKKSILFIIKFRPSSFFNVHSLELG